MRPRRQSIVVVNVRYRRFRLEKGVSLRQGLSGIMAKQLLIGFYDVRRSGFLVRSL